MFFSDYTSKLFSCFPAPFLFTRTKSLTSNVRLILHTLLYDVAVTLLFFLECIIYILLFSFSVSSSPHSSFFLFRCYFFSSMTIFTNSTIYFIISFLLLISNLRDTSLSKPCMVEYFMSVFYEFGPFLIWSLFFIVRRANDNVPYLKRFTCTFIYLHFNIDDFMRVLLQRFTFIF